MQSKVVFRVPRIMLRHHNAMGKDNNAQRDIEILSATHHVTSSQCNAEGQKRTNRYRNVQKSNLHTTEINSVT